MRCVAHASAIDQKAKCKLRRADDISGSKTALANPSLTLKLTHSLFLLHIPPAKPITHHSTPTAPPFTNASPVHLRRLLSRQPSRHLDWTTEQQPFWKHAARCQQRQRRRKNPRRNFAPRVPVKVNAAHTQNDPKAPNTNERRPRNAGFQSRVMDMVQRGPADCHQPIVRLPRSLHMHHTPAQPQPESPKANSHRNLQLPSPNAED
jgi:hypothetical protein